MRYFKISEFDSPDKKGSGEDMDKDFLQLLDVARHIAGVPFVITSGFRTKSHNKKVGGVSNSSHLNGLAADIKCDTDAERWAIVNALVQVGFNRIGIAKTFVHVDLDKSKNEKRIWLY